jgi:hypothetical protein
MVAGKLARQSHVKGTPFRTCSTPRVCTIYWVSSSAVMTSERMVAATPHAHGSIYRILFSV